MNKRSIEILRRVSISPLPLAITPEPDEIQAFPYLADSCYIDAEVRNRRDFLIRSVTPQGWDAIDASDKSEASDAFKSSTQIMNDDNLPHFITKLSLAGKIYALSILLATLIGGINLCRISMVREFFQIPVDTKIEFREVKVPMLDSRDQAVDQKIQQWIDSNESRISALHNQLLTVEKEAALYVGFEDRQRVYAEVISRLKDSIQKENEMFSKNLSTLKQNTKEPNK